jgi:DNA-binding LacI/PurR family transcriptional regulator/DNA-binding transcriptional regulator YhcF (GntR family)
MEPPTTPTETLARRILTDFDPAASESGYVRLPPFSKLTRRYGVSKTTVCRAVAHMTKRKMVQRQGPRTLYVVDPGRFGPKRALNPVSETVRAVYENLKELCLSGRFEIGTPLPKLAYFAQLFHASRLTVTRALQLLEKEGIIHKLGKSWIVGRGGAGKAGASERNVIASYGADRPVVLVIAQRFNIYCDITRKDECKPFLDAFYRQLKQHTISYRICFVEKVDDLFDIISSEAGILSSIRESRSSYRGALLLGKHLLENRSFIRKLLEFRKPVMLYDHLHETSPPDIEQLEKDSCFSRIGRDSVKSIAMIMDHLSEHGHSVVGMPLFPPHLENVYQRIWMEGRIALVRQAAAQAKPPIHIHTVQLEKPASGMRLSSECFRNPVDPGLHSRRFADRLSYAAPALRDVIIHHKATALVALNDLLARDYYLWCCSQGIAIPQEVSIVSFENYSFAEALGLTSIDFGMDTAGLQAASLFANPRRNRRGVEAGIRGRPWLMLRSSSGRIGRKTPAPKGR